MQHPPLLDRIPQREAPLRPALQPLAQRAQRHLELRELRLVGRIHQYQPAPEAGAVHHRWQQRAHGRVAVAMVHRHPRVAAEPGLQRRGLLGLQFAAGDAVLRAQRMCQQPRRARIGPGAQFGPAGRHRVEVASEQRLRRARRGQLRVAGLRLARAQGRRVVERVGTAAGVGIQRERRRRLVPERLAQAEQDHVLEDVAVVAGVEGVAVIHDASLRDHDRGHGRRVAPAPMLGGRTLSPAMSGDTLKRILLAACMSLAAGATLAQPAEPVDLDMVSRIRQEAFHRSQVMQILGELTEDIGPRLTNSPAMDRANAWARGKLEGWGLANVHDEAFADFGRGWEFGSAGMEMLAPRRLPLYALPKGWTAGTNGVVEGEAIALKLEKEADLEKHRGKL